MTFYFLFPIQGSEKVDSSKLGSLQLSATELESVVDGESVLSPQFAELLLKYPLVGGGKVTRPDCGKFSNWRGCLEVAIHELAGYHGVFTRKMHFHCGNLDCPVCCRRSWAVKSALKAEARLDAGSDRYGLPIEHLSISYDPKFYPIGDEKVFRKMELKACKALGIFGGLRIWHGSRHRRFERINGDPATKYTAFRQIGTDFSPHGHILGMIGGGFTCRDCHHKCEESCQGFNQKRWKYYKKTGIYVKVIVRGEKKYAERRSSYWSSWYEYHHASIDRDAKRARVGVWFGVLGYSKMGQIKVEKKADLCPICEIVGEEKPVNDLIYTGKKNFVLNLYDPNYQRETMQDLCEDGLQRWYIKPKRVWDSPVVKNGFTVKFEGGKHG